MLAVTKTMKSRFAATYPIEKPIFMKCRFYDFIESNNKKLLPSKIEVKKFAETNVYNLKDGLPYLRQHISDDIAPYEFSITQENVLLEKFYLGTELIHLETHLESEEAIQAFYKCIFPMYGVLVFGEFDLGEDGEQLLVRDDVCSAILHQLLHTHTNITGDWWYDDPHINHYFIYDRKERGSDNIQEIMALGGEPLERWIDKPEVTAAKFFLGKYINRMGNNAMISWHDNMEIIETFEKHFIEELLAAFKKAHVKHRIDYLAT